MDVKKKVSLLLGVILLISSSVNSDSEIIDPGVYASVPVIAVDPDNNPHIISYEINALDVRYAVKINNSWQSETVDSEGNVGDGHDIIVDNNGVPHISYRDITNGGIKYAKKVDGSWETITIDSPEQSGDSAESSSIAVDSEGNPHIAYNIQSLTTGSYLKYASWNGTSWSIETPSITGHWPSLGLDANGTPHIIYHNDVENQVVYTTRLSNGSWDVEEIDSSSVVVNDPRGDVDSSGKPHAVYRDSSGNASLRYASWNGTSWNIQIVDTNVGVSDEMDFAVKDDKPYVVYGGGSKGTRLAVLEDNWTYYTVDTTSHVCSLAVDNLNRTHVAHTYGAAEGEIIKYVLVENLSTNETPPTGTGVVINEFVPNPLGDDAGKEWVELYNSGESEVDITGWTLQGQSLSGTLTSGEWLKVNLTGEILGNTGDVITLLDDNSSTVDSVAYGDATTGAPTIPEEGCSAGRYPDGSDSWEQFENPTPGVSNAGATPSGESEIWINEFVSNPTGTDAGNEWVELYNPGEDEADLTGWSLEGQLLSGTLGAGEFLQVILASETLTDSGDTIILLDDSLTAVDEVAYGDATAEGVPSAPPDGGSTGRLPDGSDTWEQFDNPTPGEANGEDYLGDINGDDEVGLLDLAMLGQAWGSSEGDANWNSNADLNNDNTVTLLDLAILGQNWGNTYQD